MNDDAELTAWHNQGWADMRAMVMGVLADAEIRMRDSDTPADAYAVLKRIIEEIRSLEYDTP